MPALALTARDEHILQSVRRHRFLRSTHIASLVGGSRQSILRRLQLLYHHGYLERPRVQIEYFGKGGSSPIAYGLGTRGVKHLKSSFGVPFRHLRWSEKNQAVGRMFLKHALLVSDVMVALELGARRHTDIKLWSDELIPDVAENNPALNKRVPGLVPDRVFALEYADENGISNRILFFLEADRGTMPVIRKNLSRTSIFRKLLAYEGMWKKGLHRSLYGFERFRVLTVSMSSSRTASIIDAALKLKSGHGLFLFSDEQTLKSHAEIFLLPWRCVKENETETLLPWAAEARIDDALQPVAVSSHFDRARTHFHGFGLDSAWARTQGWSQSVYELNPFFKELFEPLEFFHRGFAFRYFSSKLKNLQIDFR